jgi:hypothetical protein
MASRRVTNSELGTGYRVHGSMIAHDNWLFLAANFASDVLARRPGCVVGDAAPPENGRPGPLACTSVHTMTPDPQDGLAVLIAPRQGRHGYRSDRARPLRRPAAGS